MSLPGSGGTDASLSAALDPSIGPSPRVVSVRVGTTSVVDASEADTQAHTGSGSHTIPSVGRTTGATAGGSSVGGREVGST